ncbi:MAG: proton-conducting transporter membrane subunit [Planctomycetota bacterium]
MSIYLVSHIFVFLLSCLLATAQGKKTPKIALFTTCGLNIGGIIFLILTLRYSKDGSIPTGGFNIPLLQYNISSFPLLVIVNLLTFVYLFSLIAKSMDDKSTNLLISLINFHNFLLTCAIFAKELITLFFILEFISLVNIGFILSSDNKNRKEVAIKYFVQNIVAGILYMVGAIFFYKNNTTTELIPFIEPPSMLKESDTHFFRGEYFLFFLLFFKLGIFPFQSWVPDVFEVLDSKLYTIIFSLQKSVLLFVTGQFFYIFSTHNMPKELLLPFSLILFITILISVIGAAFNRKLTRFLGYSSIYNAIFFIGLLLSPFLDKNYSYENFFFLIYLFILFYIFSTFVIFSLIDIFSIKQFEDIRMLSGIPLFLWLFFIANFLPFPLLLGFFAKVGIIVEVFTAGLYNIGIVLALSSIFAIYIYSRLIPSSFQYKQNTYRINQKLFMLFLKLLTFLVIVINIFIVKVYLFVSTLFVYY